MQKAKRRPGRPSKTESERRFHLDITLSPEAVKYLDTQSASRSRFIEHCIWEHKRKWEELAAH